MDPKDAEAMPGPGADNGGTIIQPMWIAKPISQLSDVELRQWIHVCTWQRRQGAEVPLAQTLTWNQAAQAVGVEAYVVFSDQENVGGIVLRTQTDDEVGRFECVNGPLLDWHRNDQVPRQLATFATAVSRLLPGFESLTLRPRWRRGQLEARLAGVPIEVSRLDRAATLVIDLVGPNDSGSAASWEDRITPRLRRTLASSADAFFESRFGAVSAVVTPDFAPLFGERLRRFGREHGFTAPVSGWLEKLLEVSWIPLAEGVRFFRSAASVGEGAVQAEILVAIHGDEAHYLFGWEERGEGARGAWSAQALAHLEAIRWCAREGLGLYDFNGYVVPEDRGSTGTADEAHPYARVAEFKEQWGGRVIRYEIPEIVIRV